MDVVKKFQNSQIRQANALTTAAYNLGVQEKRIVYLAIEKALNEMGSVDFLSLPLGIYEVEIDHKEFGERFEVDWSNASKHVSSAAKSIQSKSITIYLPSEDSENGEKAYDDISWTIKTKARPRRGVTTVCFNAEVIDIITRVDSNFTKFLISEASSLSNEHIMRLFESLSQYKGLGKATFRFSWLRERFCLPVSYSKITAFRSRFIEPAVNQISQKKDFKGMFYTEEKIQNDYLITFTWKVNKSSDAKVECRSELEIAVMTYQRLNSGNEIDLITKDELLVLKSLWADLMMEGFDMFVVSDSFKSLMARMSN